MYLENFGGTLAESESRVEFPWHEVEEALGEVGAIAESEEAREQAARAVHALLGWLVRGQRQPTARLDAIIGRRALAMAWSIDPSLLDASPSLARLADDLGITRAGMSWHAAEFSRTFRIHNRAQPHPMT